MTEHLSNCCKAQVSVSNRNAAKNHFDLAIAVGLIGGIKGALEVTDNFDKRAVIKVLNQAIELLDKVMGSYDRTS